MNDKTYLALDIGTVRIGMAVGSIMPFGRGTLSAQDPDKALDVIRSLINDEGIDAIIVGLPYVKSGDETESYKVAEVWIQRLKRALPELSIYTIDEAYSSVAAEEQLIREGVDIRHNKAKIDERAAELLLAQFLEEHE